MSECPEIRELAAWLESGSGPPALVTHVERCDACGETVAGLREEMDSLQIPISELWFREQISCLDDSLLADYAAGRAAADLAAYIACHLETLRCVRCQGRMGAIEAAASAEGQRRSKRSRGRVDKESVKLLGDLRKKTPRA